MWQLPAVEMLSKIGKAAPYVVAGLCMLVGGPFLLLGIAGLVQRYMEGGVSIDPTVPLLFGSGIILVVIGAILIYKAREYRPPEQASKPGRNP